MPKSESRVLQSIEEIGRSAWESLAVPNPFVSYGWLSTVENIAMDPPTFRYVTVYDGLELAGVIVSSLVAPDYRAGSLDRIIFGRAAGATARYGMSFEPALVCSAYDGYGSTMLIRRSASRAERGDIVSSLVTALRQYARKQDLSIAFCGVLDGDRELAQALLAEGFHCTLQWPVARLNPDWDSFDDYLKAMRRASKSVAKDIRRERNRLHKSGTTIATLTPDMSNAQRLHDLAVANYQRYGDEIFPYEPNFFTNLSDEMGDDAVWYGAWKAGRLVAFSLLLKLGDCAWGTYFGCDYEACGDDRTYFNLIFNHPIEDAAAKRLAKLYFGRGLHALKLRRGCESVPTYVFYRARQPLRNALLGLGLPLRSRYVARKNARAHWSDAGSHTADKG